MRIATWNVNSIRARVDRVVDFLRRAQVDAAALQETKCKDEQFPEQDFLDAGYQVAHHGLSQWNGVAVVSRLDLERVEIGFPGQPGWGESREAEARAIGATCGGVRLWSLYIPNGRELSDPHYAYKLDWLAALRQAGADWLAADGSAPIVLAGDYNVAPRNDDVWDMAVFDGKTHVSQAERDAFRALVDAGFTDVVRPHTPGPGVYTFWDYQQLRFPKKQGMRIDFALSSPAVADRVTSAWIERDERKGKGASDHAPVVVELQGQA